VSTGYGRGHYGDEQLAPRREGGGWFKVAVVVGLGVVAWKWVLPSVFGPKTPQQPQMPMQQQQQQFQQQQQPLLREPSADEDLAELARLRGFASVQAFEDAVVANARELKASGARVELAPFLQHLEPRVEAV
jgi:hypothetical protein